MAHKTAAAVAIDIITKAEVEAYLATKTSLEHQKVALCARLKAGAIIAQDSPTALALIACERTTVNWKGIATRLAKRFMGSKAAAYLKRAASRASSTEYDSLRQQRNPLYVRPTAEVLNAFKEAGKIAATA